MRRFGMMVLMVLAWSATMWAVDTASASACECKRASSIDQAVIDTPEIFFGTVERFEEREDGAWIATVKVSKNYKGRLARDGSEVEVKTGMNEEVCGYDFRPNRSYLIFATVEDDELTTSTCAYTEKLKEAPIGPAVRSLAMTPVGKGTVTERASRASGVFVGQVTDAGKGFAGRFHNAAIEVKVTTAFKGVKKGKKLTLRYDEDACTGGKKRSLLDDSDLGVGGGDVPFEKGKRYLFYTYGEDPAMVTPCHGNFVEEGVASEQLSELEKVCKGSRCEKLGEGYARASKLRGTLKAEADQKARVAIDRCAGKVPMYSSDGALTDVDLSIRALPDGKVELVNIQTSGTIADGSVYDAAVACIAGTLPEWVMTSFPGSPVEIEMEIRIKDDRRGPKFEEVRVKLLAP